MQYKRKTNLNWNYAVELSSKVFFKILNQLFNHEWIIRFNVETMQYKLWQKT